MLRVGAKYAVVVASHVGSVVDEQCQAAVTSGHGSRATIGQHHAQAVHGGVDGTGDIHKHQSLRHRYRLRMPNREHRKFNRPFRRNRTVRQKRESGQSAR